MTVLFSKWRIALLLSFCLGALCLMMAPSTAQAIGLSPPEFVVDSLLRGSTQTRSVTISRAPEDFGDIHIWVSPGDTAAKFIKEDRFVIYEGVSQYKYDVEISPGEEANGDYTVYVRFLKTSDPDEALTSGSGMKLVTGVTGVYRITVGGEENLEYSPISVSAGETEEGLEVPITYVVSNTGNVNWKADSIEYQFTSAETDELMGTYTATGDEVEAVPAGTERAVMNTIVPAELIQGEYYVTMVFYDADGETGRLVSEQPFTVLAEGTLDQNGELVTFGTENLEYGIGKKIRVDGMFRNTGQVPVNALLISSISLNGEFIDMVRGDEYRVSPSEELEITELFEFDEEGEYEIESYVEYGNRKTPKKSVTFTVSKSSTVGSSDASTDIGSIIGGEAGGGYLGLIALVVLIAVISTIVLILKKKKDRKAAASRVMPTQTPPQPPVAPPAPPQPPVQ